MVHVAFALMVGHYCGTEWEAVGRHPMVRYRALCVTNAMQFVCRRVFFGYLGENRF